MSKASFKCAYLIHGDNHQRIIERRARLARLAGEQSGVENVDVLDGDQLSPDDIAAALMTPKLLTERRFVLVDGGVQKWKASDLKGLVEALAELDDELTVAFFAYEQGRTKVAKALVEAVKAAGGDVVQEKMPTAASLPAFVVGEAKRLGIVISADAAHELVSRIGAHPAQLTREVEKLSVAQPEEQIRLETVQRFSPIGGDVSLWAFVDSVLARNRNLALQTLSQLLARGEQPVALLPPLTRRLLDTQRLVDRLLAGESVSEFKSKSKLPPWLADRRIAEAKKLAGLDGWIHTAVRRIANAEAAVRGMSQRSHQSEIVLAVIEIVEWKQQS